MDTKQRSDLVRACRLEIKRRTGAPARQLTPQEERDRNSERWLSSVDRRRPRITRRTTDADRATIRQRTRSYESDTSRRGGFAVGERAREVLASSAGPSTGSVARDRFIRRANVSLPSQTRYHSGTRTDPLARNWTNRVITPTERVNVVGVRSRRRAISPGMAPPAAGEPGHAAYVARVRAGNRRYAARRGDVGAIIDGALGSIRRQGRRR